MILHSAQALLISHPVCKGVIFSLKRETYGGWVWSRLLRGMTAAALIPKWDQGSPRRMDEQG